MTKAAALYQFWNRFGIPFFPSGSVPDESAFPYGTYELTTDNADGEPVSAIVNLWYRTTSEATPNAKAEEIGKCIDTMTPIKCDDGYIIITRGSPWCRSMTDSADGTVKRRYINVNYHFLTR